MAKYKEKIKQKDMKEWTIYVYKETRNGEQFVASKMRVGKEAWGITVGLIQDTAEQQVVDYTNRVAGAIKELGVRYVLKMDKCTRCNPLPKDFYEKMGNTIPLDLPVIKL